jgi:hypothetical protein
MSVSTFASTRLPQPSSRACNGDSLQAIGILLHQNSSSKYACSLALLPTTQSGGMQCSESCQTCTDGSNPSLRCLMPARAAGAGQVPRYRPQRNKSSSSIESCIACRASPMALWPVLHIIPHIPTPHDAASPDAEPSPRAMNASPPASSLSRGAHRLPQDSELRAQPCKPRGATHGAHACKQ